MSVRGEKGERSGHESGNQFEIVEPMNAHDAVTVRARADHATYHVVAYDDDRLRRRLSDLPAGATVRLELARAGRRANVWRATRLLPGVQTTRQ